MGEHDKLQGKSLEVIFTALGKVTKEDLEKAAELNLEGQGHIGDALLQMGVLGEEDVHQALAIQFGMERIDNPLDYQLPPEIQQKVPYRFVRKGAALPLRVDEDTVILAVSDPLNLDAVDELRMMLGSPVKPVYCPKNLISEAIDARYETESGAASEMIAGMAGGVASDEEGAVYDLLDERRDQPPIVKLLNLVLLEAIQQGASDIHFEPHEDDLVIRYRIDGVLQNRHSPAREYQTQLLTRVKVMAEMDIAERRLPQDGRIKVKMGARHIDFRVSTIPVSGGERIVLRILDKGNVVLGMDRLGMLDGALDQFKELIRSPEGIILVTGPTGSGKTTTLYSALSDVYSSEINIMTVEDPVEYKLQGIAQISVHHKIGLDFSRGLRHILRQDPDVIMIGEIRDLETAEIAIQASLTGHLVVSTLHTNDAPSAVTRLVDMGIEPYLISSSVIGVLAQRLVRTICPSCKTGYKPTDQELADLGLKRSDLGRNKFYHGEGCDACFGTGYKGRHGIYEMMTMSDGIRRQLIDNLDATALRQVAVAEGMVSLRQHGAQLVLDGVTTEAEVLRVTRGV